jgi:hypothetical protein
LKVSLIWNWLKTEFESTIILNLRFSASGEMPRRTI